MRREGGRKKAKERESGTRGQRGGVWEMGLQSLVTINSCLEVALCAFCFSSYCLGIPVGTLPALMLGSHHHPSRSDLLGKKKGNEALL